MADRVLVRMGMLLQELVSGEHHAGSTIATLQRVVCNKRLLDGMQTTAGRKPLDRHDLASLGIGCQDRAGLHRQPVHDHCAGATVAGEAADMSAGKAEVVTQEVGEQSASINLGL